MPDNYDKALVTAPGRKLDSAVAEYVFSCKVEWTENWETLKAYPHCSCSNTDHSAGGSLRYLPRFCNSWEAVSILLLSFKEYRITASNGSVECELSVMLDDVEHTFIQEAPNLPSAICFAAIDSCRKQIR